MHSNPEPAASAAERQYWQGRAALVTGATGFVGANLVRRLLALGARVHVLLRPGTSTWRLDDCLHELTGHRADLRDHGELAGAIEDCRPGVIFHLATARGTDAQGRLGYVNTGILGAAHLIEALRRLPGGRLVVAGSSLEYAPCDGPIPEHQPLLPDTLHGAVKAAAGLLYQQAARSEGLAIAQLRLFHVYGPWESGHRFLPSALRLALAGQPIPLVAGQSRRDWVHVDDVVDALIMAARPEAPAGIYNIGTGVEHGNEAVLATLEAILQRPLARQPDALAARPTDWAHRCADIRLASRALGWSPRYDLAAGIRHTLAWLERHPTAWANERGDAPVVH